MHNVAADDHAALQLIRAYLSYFPSSSWGYAPARVDGPDRGPRLVPELLDLVPVDGRRLYDMREVVSVIVDNGEFFQVQPDFGRTMVCALARPSWIHCRSCSALTGPYSRPSEPIILYMA